MATEKPLPHAVLRVVDPQTLADVEKWTSLARTIGFPDNAPVTVNSLSGNAMELRAWLRALSIPAEVDLGDTEDEDEEATPDA